MTSLPDVHEHPLELVTTSGPLIVASWESVRRPYFLFRSSVVMDTSI